MARLEAVLDESKQLMRDFPHLAAFLQATRVQSTRQSGRSGPRYPGSKALRDVVTDIVEDAQRAGTLSCNATPAVETICALTRGLSEQAARLPGEDYDATLDAVKRLIRGTLFGQARLA
nr:hypothetical protein [Mycobacterium asiaticum]